MSWPDGSMIRLVTGYGAQSGRAFFLIGTLLLTGPVLARDAGADSDAPSEVRLETPPPLPSKELPPAVELPLPAEARPENLSRAMLVGIKDITELSLEDLLNAEMTTSTKSKPMSI